MYQDNVVGAQILGAPPIYRPPSACENVRGGDTISGQSSGDTISGKFIGRAVSICPPTDNAHTLSKRTTKSDYYLSRETI